QQEDDQHRDERRRQVRRRQDRRRADALQESHLPPRDEQQREPREASVRCAVREDSGEHRPRRRPAEATARVHAREEYHEDEREEEDEERCCTASPEEELLVAELMQEEPHDSSASFAVSDRYTSSSVGRRTVRPSSSRPSATASAVSSCSTRVGSLV